MNFNNLLSRFNQASPEEFPITPRGLQVALGALNDYPDEIAPWFAELYTPEEEDFLNEYLLDLLGSDE